MRLNRAGLCVSHSKGTRLIRLLGEDHDRKVLEWKARAEGKRVQVQASKVGGNDRSEGDSDAESETSSSPPASSDGRFLPIVSGRVWEVREGGWE